MRVALVFWAFFVFLNDWVPCLLPTTVNMRALDGCSLSACVICAFSRCIFFTCLTFKFAFFSDQVSLVIDPRSFVLSSTIFSSGIRTDNELNFASAFAARRVCGKSLSESLNDSRHELIREVVDKIFADEQKTLVW